MAVIKVDFSNVSNFEPIPSAVYPVIITNVEQRDSKTSEFPYLNWELVVAEGEFENRKLWTITTLNPKGYFKLQELLIACGEKKDELTSQFEVDPERYIGSEIVVVVGQETYNGRLQNVVQSYNPRNKPIPGSPPGVRTTSGAKGPKIR